MTFTEFTYRGSDGCPLYASRIDCGRGVAAGEEDPIVLLHGGGPDHLMFVPLAHQLADLHPVILPDVRGYGRSVCTDPLQHTWARYTDDVIALLDLLGQPRAIVGGAGLGATIALRTAVAHPERVHAAILISVEDIETDERKPAEIAFMDAFAQRARNDGLEAAWAPILPGLAPIIGALVRDAIPRSDPASIAAAAAIGHDRSFRSAEELAVVTSPTLVIPGMDERHPTALAKYLARFLPNGHLASVAFSSALQTADDLAAVCAPAIREFLIAIS